MTDHVTTHQVEEAAIPTATFQAHPPTGEICACQIGTPTKGPITERFSALSKQRVTGEVAAI